MHVEKINDISVKFPFEPYPVQKKYMENIIESLKTRQNAILESPSGTGKTLSLLCATLAWMRQNKEKCGSSFQKSKSFTDFRQRQQISFRKNKSFNFGDSDEDDDEWQKPNPTIIYATRTHSQILQAMKELKKTAYKDLTATVIASRDQLCIHPKLMEKSNTDKILMCKNMMHKSTKEKNRSSCEYYRKIYETPELDDKIAKITDIEDLGSIGDVHKCCPYFISKRQAIKSDIIFIPYSYLIDPIIRKANDIKLGENSVIILDEAHNVNRVCEDSASASIKVTDISAALRDLNSINGGLYVSGSIGREERLKRSLQRLKEKLISMQMGTNSGGHLFDLLESVDISKENSSSLIELLENLITSILTSNRSTENETEANREANAPDNKRGSGLKTLLRFLQTIFSSPEKKWNSSYRMHIEKKFNRNQSAQSNNADGPINETTLHFWCFNPAIRMKSLLDLKIRCLILTSSTLTPFESFIAELGVRFPIQFISEHVIEIHQKFAKIMTHGDGNVLFDSVYNNRQNEDYLSSIGRSVREIIQRVPGGLLVFFPSYQFMENFMTFWGKDANTGIWNEISQWATICVESQDKKKFECEIKTYYKTIRERKKAIFMAVARGKISEGLDFSDIYGRAVMMVGFPCAPHCDPKVIEKKRYLDVERIQRNNLPSGNDWYISDAVRTANQAMGRVIRHRHDYGAMLLCDRRFGKKGNKELISKWIRARLNKQKSATFDQQVQELSLFYDNAERELPMHDPEINPESFVLYEDDEWCSTVQFPETQPEELSADQHTDDSADEADNSVDDSNSNKVFDQQPTNQEEEENTRKRRTSTATCDQNSASNSAMNVLESDDSGDESGVQPKRTRKSKKNTIESDSESEGNQYENSELLINFMKKSLKGDKYKKLENVVSKYSKDAKYEQFRDELFNVFREPEFVFILKGCIILFKKEHQSNFQTDCEQFIKSCQ